jgi:hypothetical protein
VKELMMVVFIGFALTPFQTKHVDWKALVPLVTTRTQLEVHLGTPTSGNGNIFVYETPNEKLHVWYGGGKSIGADVCCWKVPNEMLFKFELVPKRAVPLAEVSIDLTAFQKQKAPEMVNDYYYYNDNEGMTITTRIVEGKEVLLSIERGPNSTQRERSCRKKNC